VGLRYETTSVQMRSVIDGIRNLIVAHSDVDVDSVRVRFFRLGASSLDVEVFAYVFASNWNRFLEIQQELLLRIMEIVEASGTEIAFPSQTLRLVEPRSPVSVARSDASVTPTPVGARPDRVASA
jgi:MscS family membrane protein